MALYAVFVSEDALLKHCTGDLDLRLPSGCKKQNIIVQCVRCHFENGIRKARRRSRCFWPSHLWCSLYRKPKRQVTGYGASQSPLCHALSLHREPFKSQCDGEKLLFGRGIRFLGIISWLNVLIKRLESVPSKFSTSAEDNYLVMHHFKRKNIEIHTVHAKGQENCAANEFAQSFWPKKSISFVLNNITLIARLFIVCSVWKVNSVLARTMPTVKQIRIHEKIPF